MILLEIDALNLVTGLVETLRYADKGISTRPTDIPSEVYFVPRLGEGLRSSRRIPLGALGGRPQATFGDIVLNNQDGALDGLSAYAFDGREFRVWYFDSEPSAYVLPGAESFKGLVAQPLIGYEQVRFKVLDLTPVYFTRPLLTAIYAGTNIDEAGLEGGPGDLKGQRKPRLYGVVQNIAPRLVNSIKNIYQVSDRPGTLMFHAAGGDCVFDMGVVIGKDSAADYLSVSQLEASAPAAGKYRLYSGPEGLFVRVGSPASQLTVDAAASGGSTPQQIATALIADIGLPSGSSTPISPPTGNTPGCGVYLEDESTAADVLERICPADNLWFGFDRLNRFSMAKVRLGWISSVELNELEIQSIQPVRDGDDGGAPVRSVRVPYQRLHTVQSQVAGAATPARRALVMQAVRYATAENPLAAQQRLLARDVEVNADLSSANGAAAVADSWLAFYGSERLLVDVVVACTASRLQKIDVGKYVKLSHPRFGLQAGRVFLVVGVEVEVGRDVGAMRISLWG